MDGKTILVSARDIARIKSSLRIIAAFEKEGIRYRVMGSLILAAIHGSAHRPIGDIDLILDARDRKKVLEILKRNGLRLKKNTKYGFSWTEASSPRHILFTLLLVGRFRDGRFTYRVSKNVSMSILEEYLSPSVYNLYGFSFIGIPARSAYEGLKVSSLNPKRSRDKALLLSALGGKVPEGPSLMRSFDIHWRGIRIPLAYGVFSYLYNLYGGARVRLGKKYEIFH